MIHAAALLFAVSLALRPDAALRVYNPHEAAVDAVIDCAGTTHALRVEAKDTLDLAPCAMAAVDAPLPLTLIETAIDEGEETQRLLGTDATCEPLVVHAPLFGCRLGTAAVAVSQIAGAVYAWSVEGASVVSGHGTNRLVLTLGEGSSAKVTATVTGECAATAEAVIGLRTPLVFEKFEVPAAATADSETTIQWSYANGATPRSQLLSGEAFETPVALAGDVRSYTWTPKTTGSKNVELRASYSPAISTKPPKRRRATGSTRALATECPSARATGRVEVGGCGTLNVSIDAPESVEAGSTFIAAIFLRAGETVEWTIEGGTILSGATTDTVTVKAGEVPGRINLYARVTAGPECHRTVESRVDVVERAACTANPPTVALAIEKVGCNYATVKATFTGTPPFRGWWSDNTPFETSSTTLTHDFQHPMTYSIAGFRDASCAGQVTETARVTAFGLTANVRMVGGTCLPGPKAVATFTGTPPFTGKWLYGEWFVTNETTVERTDFEVFSVAQIEYLRDAECTETYISSNRIDLERRPTARLRELAFCTTNVNMSATLRVDVSSIEGAQPPFTVYWSDGVVTKGGKFDHTILRTVTGTAPQTSLSILRVAGKTCDAILDPERSTATITYRKNPEIDRSGSDIEACIGSTMKIRVKPGHHPDAQLAWSVTAGEIVSGQGTPEVTVLQSGPTAARVTLQASYPDEPSCPIFPDSVMTWLVRPGEIELFSVTPQTIPAGGTAEIRYVINDEIEWLGIGATPSGRESDFSLGASDCTDIYGRDCTIEYKDTHGPGVVTLTLFVGNECGSLSKPITLTIE